MSNNGNGSWSGLGNGLPCSGSMSNGPGSGSSSGSSFGSIGSSTGNSSDGVLLGLGNGGMRTMLGLKNGLGDLKSLLGIYGFTTGTLQNFQYPLRSDHGSEGRNISIQPDNCSRRVNRKIVETMIQKGFIGQRPFFDGWKNLYSRDPPPIGREKAEFKVALPGEGRDCVFHVAIKFVAKESLYALDETREGKGSPVPADVIQALDVVVMRHLSSLTYMPVGRSFFSPPERYSHPLGGGPEVWFGFHQSVRPSYLKMLNIDGAIQRGFLVMKSLFCALSLDNQTRVHNQLESSGVTSSSDVTAQSMGVRLQLPPSTGMLTGTPDSSYVELHADQILGEASVEVIQGLPAQPAEIISSRHGQNADINRIIPLLAELIDLHAIPFHHGQPADIFPPLPEFIDLREIPFHHGQPADIFPPLPEFIDLREISLHHG